MYEETIQSKEAGFSYARIDSTNVLYPKFSFYHLFHDYESIFYQSENTFIAFKANHFFNLRTEYSPKEYVKDLHDSFTQFISIAKERIVQLFGEKVELSGDLITNIRNRLLLSKTRFAVHSALSAIEAITEKLSKSTI